jgi:hypothetical protein
MATHVLEYKEDYNFEVVGISSHEKDYRLVWSINKSLKWSLQRKKDIEVHLKAGKSLHACFEYCDPIDKCVYTLIENHGSEGYLLPEMTSWDFIIKVEELNEELDSSFFKQLRKTPFILATAPLLTEKLKSKQNLIFA